MKKTNRSSKALIHWLTFRKRKYLSSTLGFLFMIGGGSLGIILGILVVLYFEGGGCTYPRGLYRQKIGI